MKRIFIAFAAEGKTDQQARQMLQLLQQFYQLEFAPEQCTFLNSYVPIGQIAGDVPNKSLAQCAQLYGQLANADFAVFVGNWSQDSISRLLKGACDNYRIPHHAMVEFRDAEPVNPLRQTTD